MRWIKASERLPELDTILCLKFNGFYCSGQFNSRYGRMECDIAWRGTYLEASFGLIEWLDESLPASAVEEAARMYPDVDENVTVSMGHNGVQDLRREANITCAGMYTGEIDRLKGLLKFWVAPCECETCTKNWDEYKAKHNL